MSHFYGTVRGGRGEATRCGHKTSGLTTNAAGHYGSVRVHVWYDDDHDCDRFSVDLTPWCGSGGESRPLVSGLLDAHAGTRKPVENALGAIQFALHSLAQYNG